MIDHAEIVASRDAIEVGVHVRVYDAAGLDDGRDESRAFALAANERSAVPSTLPHDDHTPTFATAMSQTPAIDAFGMTVARTDIAAEIGTVDFDSAAKLACVLVGRDGFPELVLPDEGRLIGDLKLLAHPDSAEPLRSVDEMGDEQKQFAIGQLAAREDSA